MRAIAVATVFVGIVVGAGCGPDEHSVPGATAPTFDVYYAVDVWPAGGDGWEQRDFTHDRDVANKNAARWVGANEAVRVILVQENELEYYGEDKPRSSIGGIAQ